MLCINLCKFTRRQHHIPSTVMGSLLSDIHRDSGKSRSVLFFGENFGKMDPFPILFTVKLRKNLRRKLPLPLKLVEKYKWSKYSLTAQLIQLRVKQIPLITVNFHRGWYFFVWLHRLFYHMCLKCLHSSIHAVSGARHGQWRRRLCVVQSMCMC